MKEYYDSPPYFSRDGVFLRDGGEQVLGGGGRLQRAAQQRHRAARGQRQRVALRHHATPRQQATFVIRIGI